MLRKFRYLRSIILPIFIADDELIKFDMVQSKSVLDLVLWYSTRINIATQNVLFVISLWMMRNCQIISLNFPLLTIVREQRKK